MHSWRASAVVLGSSIVALAVVDACASGAEHAAGRMMVDAGSTLIDASTAGRRAGSGGSAAPGGSVSQGGAGADAMSGGRSGAAGILADAGQLLVDAGNSLLDASDDAQADAAAQQPSGKSGTRIELRQTVQTGSDGTRYEFPFLNYYDTKLKTMCTLNTMSDATKRCTPTATIFAGLYFADSTCQTKLAYFYSTCADIALPTYFAETVASTGPSCASSSSYLRVFPPGAEYAGSVYTKSTTCSPFARPMGYRFFALGPEMSPSEFVEFDETLEAY